MYAMRLTVLLKIKLPSSRETRLRETSFSRVHWKYQYFAFVNIQTCFVYYHTDLCGRHDFHSHQRCVCTMCVLRELLFAFASRQLAAACGRLLLDPTRHKDFFAVGS